MLNVMLAGGTAMLLALLGAPLFIRFLVRRGSGQPIHDDLVLHHVKRGKPTMGGTVIITPVRGDLLGPLVGGVHGVRPAHGVVVVGAGVPNCSIRSATNSAVSRA